MLRESIQIGSFAGHVPRPARSTTRIHLCHDVRMKLHGPPDGAADPPRDEDDGGEKSAAVLRPECPERVEVCYEKLLELEEKLLEGMAEDSLGVIGDFGEDDDDDADDAHLDHRKRFLTVKCEPADRSTIELVHTAEHYDNLYETSQMTNDELIAKTASVEKDDLVYNENTFDAARIAVGATISCVTAATTKSRGSNRALALVRPPGHHATAGSAMGFCYLNNAVVAARHAMQSQNSVERVAILDWDVHHGNGTQDLTYDDPNILYISLHRHHHGQDWNFYPGTGNPSEIGTTRASGTNLNVAFTEPAMGDAEYAAAMSELVLPVLAAFQPSLVLVSAGFDASYDDPVGDCCVSPGGYHAMTRSILKTVGADVPVVAVLEGGYNLDVLPLCVEAVALALLDEPFEAPEVEATGRLPTDLLEEMFGESSGHGSFNFGDGDDDNADWMKDAPTTATATATERRTSAVAARRGTTFGRAELFQYWRHPEREGVADAADDGATDIQPRLGGDDGDDHPPPPNVKPVAIRDINLSMRYLRAAPMWKDMWKLRIVDLHDIPEPQAEDDAESSEKGG